MDVDSQKIILYNKKKGEILSEVITNVRKINNIPPNVKAAYAGRLDPMAKGLILILVGEECKKRDLYQDFDKEYEFEVLFGYKTDSKDFLGVIEDYNNINKYHASGIQNAINIKLKGFIGRIEQEYPLYSSKTVQGKPLFWWARNNLIEEIHIPKKKGEIRFIKLKSVKSIDLQKLIKKEIEIIKYLKGDFRQEQIIKQWKNVTDDTGLLAKVQIKVTSGVYVRNIAENIAELIGLNGIAININRKSVGEHTL